jgi:multidrug efflux pump subunit AcrB
VTHLGFAGRLARAFADSRLTPLLGASALIVGLLALLSTPREEEPQIRVPMVDVTVAWPGAEPEEVASRVMAPIERAMWGLPGVEHVYSTAGAGYALVTVRFDVGEHNEPSLVKVFERLSVLGSFLPAGAYPPAVELHSIDDVPFLALTLWSPQRGSGELRPIAAELAQELSELPEVAKAKVIGGAPRVVRVEPDPARMAAHGVSWERLSGALRSAAARATAGTAVRAGEETRVEARAVYASAEDVAAVVVAAGPGGPVYVKDVAAVQDGPDEATDAVFHVVGRHEGSAEVPAGTQVPAVTISLAKRSGANATALADDALAKAEALRARLLPADVRTTVTRNYGRTARDKSDELVHHLLLATLSVAALIAFTMGWRAGLVVLIAVPVTLALTLFVFAVFGYTLNRVTLFALIFSIGILVDDAIVVVENIERHHRMKPGRSLLEVAIKAVDEVGNPTILATFTVIAAILPMAFVRGLMGPYMEPIPTGASAAMIFSLVVAFVISPWAALRIFKNDHAGEHGEGGRHGTGDGFTPAPEPVEGWSEKLYRRVMTTLVTQRRPRVMFLSGVFLILLASMALVGFGLVKIKMLPFDNKSELQVLVDHDEGTPVEETLETARRLARHLATVPEVDNVQVYAGAPAPVNFNGLVRHYFLRRMPHAADLQVNLVDKSERDAQSHDLAKRLRPALQEIGRARGAKVKVVEVPPGPPVLDTLVAEIYGESPQAREKLAGVVRGLYEKTEGVVDVDDSLHAARERVVLVPDREKAALKGVPAMAVVEAIAGAGEGRDAALLQTESSREPVPVRLRLSAADRADLDRRLAVRVETPGGASVALSELVRVERRPEPQPILHKDLKPVVYVFGDLAGERESPLYALADLKAQVEALELPGGVKVDQHWTGAPETSDRPALKWDGEWQVTWEVFRDLGIAFAVVLVLIAILVVGWFQSFSVPLAILLPIPLSLIGILPAHWLMGAFFTATSMIGFIAGAGIIVRNSIILVDFIELKLAEGMPLEEAVVEAGVVRFRPMLLTAAAVVVGSAVMLADPIFQGLAVALMSGEIAATFLSRLAVPVVYSQIARRGRAEEVRTAGAVHTEE